MYRELYRQGNRGTSWTPTEHQRVSSLKTPEGDDALISAGDESWCHVRASVVGLTDHDINRVINPLFSESDLRYRPSIPRSATWRTASWRVSFAGRTS